ARPDECQRYPSVPHTRGPSSCCTLAENSHCYPRCPHPVSVSGEEALLAVTRPKFVSETMPHSPFRSTFVRSQSGTKLPRRGSPAGKRLSFHDRVTNSPRLETGSSAPFMKPTWVPSACTYFARLTFAAVLRAPKTC